MFFPDSGIIVLRRRLSLVNTPEGKFIFNNFQIDDITVEEASAKIFDMIDNCIGGYYEI